MDLQDTKPRKISLGIPGFFYLSTGWTIDKPEGMPDKGNWNLPGDLPGYWHLYGEAFGLVKLGGFWELV